MPVGAHPSKMLLETLAGVSRKLTAASISQHRLAVWPECLYTA
jgi:hypothetical protein